MMADWIIRRSRPDGPVTSVDIRRAFPFQGSAGVPGGTDLGEPRACCTQCTGRSGSTKAPATSIPLARTRSHRGCRWSVRRGRRLGAPQLVRRRGPGSCLRVQLRQNRTGSKPQGQSAAVRNAVGLFDQTCFVKLVVEGPDATLASLNEICANDIDVPIGKAVYTQWCNDGGGIEADLTVTRTGGIEEFFVVTAAASGTRDIAWLRAGCQRSTACQSQT